MDSLWQPTIDINPIKPSGAPPSQSGRRGRNIKKSPSSNLNRSNNFYSDGSDRGSGPNPFAAGMNETKAMSGMEDTEFNDPIENVLDRISEAIRKKETLVLKMGDSEHLLEYIQFLDEQTIEAINNPDPKVIYSSNEYIELAEVLAKYLDSTINIKKRLAKCKKELAKCKKELAENDDHLIMAGTGKKKRKRKKKKKGGTRKNNISSIYKMGSCSANSEENFASVPLTGGRRRRRRSRRRRPRKTKKRKSKSRKRRRTVRKRRRRRRR